MYRYCIVIPLFYLFVYIKPEKFINILIYIYLRCHDDPSSKDVLLMQNSLWRESTRARTFHVPRNNRYR